MSKPTGNKNGEVSLAVANNDQGTIKIHLLVDRTQQVSYIIPRGVAASLVSGLATALVKF